MHPKDWIPNLHAKRRISIVAAVFIEITGILNFVSFAQTAAPAPAKPGPPITNDQRAFFEAKIRPVLTDKCFSCHSATSKDIQGGLLLDSRMAVLHGGENGPVIVPGNPDKSVLIQAIRYGNKDLAMPPDDGGGKLSDAVIHDFETWVKMGAPDPRDGGTLAAPKTYDTTAAKKWWSFQPLKRPDPADVASDWPHGDIDKYVFSALQAKELKPVGDADKQTLIRRIYFDLIGLPPTPEQVDAFVKDDSPDSYEKVVDNLLASPQFGEHWGRHWLDVARYAESTGKEVNEAYPNAWRYRDYVIDAFNQDKPYDQFVREQLAGDQLQSKDIKTRVDQVVATGFLAIGPKGLSETASRQFDLDLADEQVDATSQAFLGLTVSCARCHDHKFDPILQKDYYSMAGIFLSTKTFYGTIPGPRNNQDSALFEIPAAANMPVVQKPQTPEERAKLKQDLADATLQYDELVASRGGGRRAAKAQPQDPSKAANAVQLNAEIRNAQGKKDQLQAQMDLYDDSGKPKAFCMGAIDRPASIGRVEPMPAIKLGPAGNAVKNQPSGFETIADSPLFFRGEMSDPRDRVARGFPVFLTTSRAPSISRSESGRKELADWIVSGNNPLTARVMANRIWYWLFGQGIVGSVDNFGSMGDTPSNQQLLDYLACKLISNRWSIKKTIREIVLSHTYQEAPTYDETDFGVDPQNALIWRHSKLRLNAECIRDAMLEASGELNLKPPLGSPIAVAGDGGIGSGPAYDRINEEQLISITGTYRSVYLPVARDELPDSMAVFDYPDSTVVNGARETTNVPGQALYLLNSDFVRAQARALAMRIFAEYPPGAPGFNPASLRQQRVTMAFKLVLDRPPTDDEQKAAADFFSKMVNDPAVKGPGVWADFCLGLFNTAEFRYSN